MARSTQTREANAHFSADLLEFDPERSFPAVAKSPSAKLRRDIKRLRRPAGDSPRPTPTQPFLKWVGGKGGLLSQLLPLLPPDFENRKYFEPFLGGGAMFFHLAPTAGAVLGDMNRELVACYQTVRDDVNKVLERLAILARTHSAEQFYDLRKKWNSGELRSRTERAAIFIYFNRTCFNGLWRVNRQGHYNVPMGRYANPLIYLPDRLIPAANALTTAQIHLGGYEQTLAQARKGDFVYFDPPYQPISDTANFTGYNAEPFGSDEQSRLAAMFEELDRRGCLLMLSNSDAPLIVSLYKHFRIDRVSAARNVNSRADRRGRVSEVVVRNY